MKQSRLTSVDVEGQYLALRFFLSEARAWGNYQERGALYVGRPLLRTLGDLERVLAVVRSDWDAGRASVDEAYGAMSEFAAVLFEVVQPSRLFAEFMAWSRSGELERRVERFELEYRGGFV